MLFPFLVAVLAVSTTEAHVEPKPPVPKIATLGIVQIGYPLRTPAVTGIKLLVSSTGRVVTCAVSEPSGVDDLDKQVCIVPKAYYKFKPAEDAAGQPISSVYETRVIYMPVFGQGLLVVPEGAGGGAVAEAQAKKAGLFATQYNMVVGLKSMPDDVKDAPVLDVLITVSEAGAIEQCMPVPSKVATILGSAACNQVQANWKSHPVVDDHDKPVRALLPLHIKFAVDGGS